MNGIITLQNYMAYNFGGTLQSYALCYYLNSKGYKTNLIYCNANTLFSAIKLYCFDRFGLKILTNNKKIKFIGKQEKSRNKNFRDFINENIELKKYHYYGEKTYKKINKRFDKVIVGSDQVWNPYWVLNGLSYNTMFLTFLPKEKKVSYAASMGVAEVPKNQKNKIAEALKEFDNISVREEAGAKEIKKIAGKDAEVLIDPTLLLSKEEWLSVSKKSKIDKNKSYILKYFLGKETNERKESIDKLAKDNSLEVYTLLDKSNSDIYEAGPAEFIDLIANAKLVVTDSFHAIVFSILFEKPFLIMERMDDKNKNMMSRIDTLLSKLHLEEKLMKNITDKNVFEANYTKAFEHLEIERKKSDKFIKRALNSIV